MDEFLHNAMHTQNNEAVHMCIENGRCDLVVLLATVTPLRDTQGCLLGGIIIAHEVQPSELSNNDFNDVVNLSWSAIFTTDLQGKIEDYNWKAKELANGNGDVLKGSNFVSRFVAKEDWTRAHQLFAAAQAGENPSSHFKINNGTEVLDMCIHASLRRDEKGEVKGLAISCRDGVETKLETMTNDLQKLVDALDGPIFGINSSGHVTEWNDKMAELTGFDVEVSCIRALAHPFGPRKGRCCDCSRKTRQKGPNG